MGIGRIDPAKNYNRYNRTQKKTAADHPGNAAAVSISQEAREKAELQRITDIVKSAPDVRADRVAEVIGKLNNPDYINSTVLSDTADKILDVFGI